MLQQNLHVTDVEQKFELSELFFSTTDRRGVITACNEVFLRVAEYAPHEILGAPHNCIRHPDMPRCVFMLLWEYLLSGRPIGAYVKNRAKNGGYYWVFALARPIPEGFLSIRLKPSSAFFELMGPLYRELLNVEESFGRDWKTGMASSAQKLMSFLTEKGFGSYDEFMTQALRAELLSRREGIGISGELKEARGVDLILSGLGELDDLQGKLRVCEKVLKGLGTTVGRVSLNAAVCAAHLGTHAEGAALSAISDEVSRVSAGVSEESSTLERETRQLAASARLAAFNAAMAKLQEEMILSFRKEQAGRNISSAEQISRYGFEIEKLTALLEQSIESSSGEMVQSIASFRDSLRVFSSVASALEKILLTIRFSYVTGKSLAARVEHGEKFSILLGDLVTYSERVREQISALQTAVSKVSTLAVVWHREAGHSTSSQVL